MASLLFVTCFIALVFTMFGMSFGLFAFVGSEKFKSPADGKKHKRDDKDRSTSQVGASRIASTAQSRVGTGTSAMEASPSQLMAAGYSPSQLGEFMQ